MTYVPYFEKLKDPRWQAKRLRIMDRDKFTCRSCGETAKPLHVHHSRYDKGRDPWDYSDCDLVTLCAGCHEAIGQTITNIGDALQVLFDHNKQHLEFVLAKLYTMLDQKLSINGEVAAAWSEINQRYDREGPRIGIPVIDDVRRFNTDVFNG